MNEYFSSQPQENKFFLILITDTGVEKSYSHGFTTNPEELEDNFEFKEFFNTIPVFIRKERYDISLQSGKKIKFKTKISLKFKPNV